MFAFCFHPKSYTAAAESGSKSNRRAQRRPAPPLAAEPFSLRSSFHVSPGNPQHVCLLPIHPFDVRGNLAAAALREEPLLSGGSEPRDHSAARRSAHGQIAEAQAVPQHRGRVPGPSGHAAAEDVPRVRGELVHLQPGRQREHQGGQGPAAARPPEGGGHGGPARGQRAAVRLDLAGAGQAGMHRLAAEHQHPSQVSAALLLLLWSRGPGRRGW